jgi:hypothetical protein
MATATAESQYLFHIVSEEEPYLFRKRHIDIEVSQESFDTRSPIVMAVVMHNPSPFSL